MKYRTVIRKAIRTARGLAPRLGAAAMAVVLVTMGGGRGMDAHAAPHGWHPGHRMAAHASAGAEHAAHHGSASHASHHGAASSNESDDTKPDAPVECTCVGPCQGGTAPGDTRTPSSELADGAVRQVYLPMPAQRIVPHDARAHILPFPTAPPARV